MTRNVRQKGATLRLEVTFEDLDGVVADPAAVALLVTDPAGITTEFLTPDVVNDPAGTGQFYCDVPVTMAGEWHYRWEGSGPTLEATKRGEFIVEPADFVVPAP